MNDEVFEVLDPGLGATVQDEGRWGWRRFGVPPSGAMDDHAAGWANRLLGNPVDSPVLELLMQGARLAARQTVWIAVTGAHAEANVPVWRLTRVKAGGTIHFSHNRSGLWIYVAVENGFEAERWLGSASVYRRGNLGKPLARGDVLCRVPGPDLQLPAGVAGRMAASQAQRNYNSPPPLRVWRGPQWDWFREADRDAFFTQEWTVTPECDRVGYRLAGCQLKPQPAELISEPVRVGSVQVPPAGQPIVIMRDGPTVGGYPKLGIIDPSDLSWLTQCRPGQKVRFRSTA